MTAQQYAEQVAKFIAHNKIDVTKYSMDEIMKAYLQSQLKAIEEAGKQILAKRQSN